MPDAAEWTDFDVERVVRGAADDEVPAGSGHGGPVPRRAGSGRGDETTDRVGIATALASSTAVLPIVERPAWWRTPRRVATVAVAACMLLSGVAAAATNGLGPR